MMNFSESELQVVDRLATRCSVEATSVASKLNAIQNAVLLWLDTMVGLAQVGFIPFFFYSF